MTPYFLHSILAVYYIFFFIYTLFIFVLPPSMYMVHDHFIYGLMAGPAQYFSIWNVVLQGAYFFMALLNDFLIANDYVPSKVFRRIKDYLFCSLVFPTTLYVSILYWSLIVVDEKLIIPKILVEFYSPNLCHAMHTLVIVFNILEILTTFHQYPSVTGGLFSLTVLFAAYTAWTMIIYFYAGFWVYPFLEIMSWSGITVFYFYNFVVGYCFYFAGQFLHNAVWADHKSQLKRTEMKKVT